MKTGEWGQLSSRPCPECGAPNSLRTSRCWICQARIDEASEQSTVHIWVSSGAGPSAFPDKVHAWWIVVQGVIILLVLALLITLGLHSWWLATAFGIVVVLTMLVILANVFDLQYRHSVNRSTGELFTLVLQFFGLVLAGILALGAVVIALFVVCAALSAN